jgi:D-beta-D-heptose 7-phosphate kinase/D-beta-D-heptose 1-phosphate adenosyltransferase
MVLLRNFNQYSTLRIMKKQLPDFTKAAVLVVGDLMLDRYWFGDASRISPEAPVPVVRIKQTDERPGGAGNVALNIAALGAKVTLIGLIGKDESANTLCRQLSEAGVSHDLQCMDDMQTITKLRVISRHQQLIRLDFEESLPAFDPKHIISAFKKHLTTADVVILSDYSKGTLSCVQELIQLANASGKIILVDPKGYDFSIYNGATVITPNFKEFETVVGPCADKPTLLAKSELFLQKNNIQALLLTRGEHGMSLLAKDQPELHLPAHAREVFDVTGAGDTVIAVLGCAMAAGASLPYAMALANLAASLAVSKLGAATVSAAELQVAQNGGLIMDSGIMSEDQLLLAVSDARINGKRIVFTNGCFDILHAGHVTYLQQAKQLGDYLIVAINDDASVQRLKGPSRPINTVEQRLAVLASLGVVDWVISYSENTPEALLRKLQPDILVKGGDYTIDKVVGAGIVHAYGGDVRVLGIVDNLSTTAIINRAAKQHLENF